MGERHRTWTTAVAISNAFNAFLPYLGLHHVMFHMFMMFCKASNAVCSKSGVCSLTWCWHWPSPAQKINIVLVPPNFQWIQVVSNSLQRSLANIGKTFQFFTLISSMSAFTVSLCIPYLRNSAVIKTYLDWQDAARVIWFTMMSFTQLQVAEPNNLQKSDGIVSTAW